MRIADVIDALERLAPLDLAESWDNVGLLIGDAERDLSGPVMLTIDFRDAAMDEARRAGAGLVVAYHPPIFHPLKRLTREEAAGRAALGAAEAGISVYSPHTALDAAPGGVTDWLCDLLAETPPESSEPIAAADPQLGDRRALTPHESSVEECKIVVFVPHDHVESVRNALASIGAGRIGDYDLCSYMLEGRGTFRGGEGTDPAVGQAGRLETAREVRLEMVCPTRALALARTMLEQFHPYEEPAWDVFPLAPRPDRRVGAGRRLILDRPATPEALARRLKSGLGVDSVKVAAASEEPASVVGVCPGAGASLLESAIADGCTLFVTGEMRHHEVIDAVSRGCSVILAGHTNTERGYLPRLRTRLLRTLGNAAPEVRLCESDRSPFRAL